MTYSQERALVEQARHAVVTPVPSGEQLQCLVVAPAGVDRRELVESARHAGWFVFECDGLGSAAKTHHRTFLQLVMVDLREAGGEQHRELQEVVRLFSRERGVLTVVCARDGKTADEMWVRQLGVWLYLPGEIDPSQLTLLCGEARELARRLAITRASPVGANSTWG